MREDLLTTGPAGPRSLLDESSVAEHLSSLTAYAQVKQSTHCEPRYTLKLGV